eukprot:TRINITY_DN297_c2_g1_i1.p1 TRINITY_DN297_c2_g1~~TRINITY_DN297_c2_g1_i1.p1  ORF type:complete len:491 (+),score=162.02 TRINITY_DN297_c2_g1_i1:87-1559(+)
MPSLAHTGTVGNFHVKKDDVIAGRYRVLEEAGAGNFARVLKAADMQSDNKIVAVKILRREYQRDAQFEHEILTAINRNDKNNEFKVCKMITHFNWGGLPCFVFGLLGQSLKSCKYGPGHVSDEDIAHFAKQSCHTLSFLHFSCKLIHTDLKPENILLDQPALGGLKGIGSGWAICDLGSASFYSAKPDQDLIQTRPYRAPEVVLGCPWSYAVDMWSIGCILYELRKGRKLFDAMNDEQQLIMFEKRFGPLPSWLVRSGATKQRRQFFDSHDRLVHSQSVFSNPYGNSAPLMSLKEELKGEPEFLDFLLKCFEYDPVLRMRADEAAHHPWVQQYFTPDTALLRRLPTSAYTSGAITSPAQKLIVDNLPLTSEQRSRLERRTPSPPIKEFEALSVREEEAVMRRAGSALMGHHHINLPPHLKPAAGMPSAGRPIRGPIMAPSRVTPPVPPSSNDRYVTSSSAYGSSIRGSVRSIPAPTNPRSIPAPVLTPNY